MSADGALGPLEARIEAVLFSSAEPVPLARLATACGVREAQARQAIGQLRLHLDTHGHGVALAELAGGYQLLTREEHADAVTLLAAPRAHPLSRAALEVLAIVAFRQPITRAAVDELRGVHSDGALATLVDRGLVAEVGRADGPGRPILYATTRQFLAQFGLRSLEDLARLEAAGEEGLPLLRGTAQVSGGERTAQDDDR